MSKANQKPRLFFLDAARGLAILLVVLGHIWETEDLIPVWIYSFHVPLFFIISGMLLHYTEAPKRPWKALLLSRLRGLLVPYLAYELIFVVIFGLRNGFDFTALSGNAWDGLLLNPLNTPLWFLICLFFSELILILFLKLFQKSWIAALLCLALYLLPFFAESGCYGMELLLKTCSALGFLALGYFTAGLLQKTELPLYLILPTLAVSGIAAWYNGKTGINKLTFHNPMLFTFCAAVTSFCLLFLLKKLRLPLLEFFGKNTLPILGLHIIVLRIFQQALGFSTDTIFGGLAALVFICLLLTPVCLFLNRYLPILAGKRKRQN